MGDIIPHTPPRRAGKAIPWIAIKNSAAGGAAGKEECKSGAFIFFWGGLFISSSPKAMSYPPRYPLLTVSPLPPFGDPSSILLRNLHISL